MTWILLLVFWSNGAITEVKIEFADERLCRHALVKAYEVTKAEAASMNVLGFCTQLREKTCNDVGGCASVTIVPLKK